MVSNLTELFVFCYVSNDKESWFHALRLASGFYGEVLRMAITVT